MCRFLLLACLLTLTSGLRVSADETPSAISRIAASLTIAQSGMARQDADLLVTAVELLSSQKLSGQTATRLKRSYETEARFLIRGDEALRKRLDLAVTSTPVLQDEPNYWLVFRGAPFEIPEGQRISAYLAESGAPARVLFGESGDACRKTDQIWYCAQSANPLSLPSNEDSSGDEWIVLETRPLSP